MGHHWPLDGPLPQEVRDNIERQGVCLSCHQEIPEARFVYRIISKLGDALGMIPATDTEHQKLVGKAMFIAANLEILWPPCRHRRHSALRRGGTKKESLIIRCEWAYVLLLLRRVCLEIEPESRF